MAEKSNPFATNAELRAHHARMKSPAVNPFASAPVPTAADDSTAAPSASSNTLEELLDRAEELRIEKAAVVKALDEERAQVARDIFRLRGGETGKHVVGGREFTFRKPAVRRSADYTLLESMYPAAYAAAVKVTEPDPEAMPTLILGKGFQK